MSQIEITSPSLPISPPPVPPTAVPATPPKPPSRFPLLIGLLVLIILGLSSYITYMKFTDSAVSNYDECVTITGSRIQESNPSTCITPTGKRFTQIIEEPQNKYDLGNPLNPDPTTNWQTYQDNKNGFSFKYPSNWNTLQLGQNQETLMIAPKEDIDSVKNIQGGFGGGDFLRITLNTMDQPPTWKSDEFMQVTSQPAEVNSLPATQYNISVIQNAPGFNKGAQITSIVLEKNKQYFQIDLLDPTHKETFSQILQTFQFIEDPSKLYRVLP